MKKSAAVLLVGFITVFSLSGCVSVKSILGIREVAFKYMRGGGRFSGWFIQRDVPFDGKQFIPGIMGLLKSNESISGYLQSKVLIQRAEELNANLGQHHAEYLLDHQELIPKEWKGYSLVFPGTVWKNQAYSEFVPCLEYGGGGWYLEFSQTTNEWDPSRSYFVRIRE